MRVSFVPVFLQQHLDLFGVVSQGAAETHRAFTPPDLQEAPFHGHLRELERAVLPVEGEVVDVDGAGGAEDGGRQPVAETRRIHQDVAVVGNLELGVVTKHRER